MSVKWSEDKEKKELSPNTWRDYAFLALICLSILSLYLGAFPSHFNKTQCEVASGIFFASAVLVIVIDSVMKGNGE